MTIKNRFVALNEQDAAQQLEALYGKKPTRTGATKTHITWYVKNHNAQMAKASHHRNGHNQPMFIVEVR